MTSLLATRQHSSPSLINPVCMATQTSTACLTRLINHLFCDAVQSRRGTSSASAPLSLHVMVTVLTLRVLQNHPGQGAPPTGGVTFYNPAQFAQVSLRWRIMQFFGGRGVHPPFTVLCLFFSDKCAIRWWTPRRPSGRSAAVPSVEMK